MLGCAIVQQHQVEACSNNGNLISNLFAVCVMQPRRWQQSNKGLRYWPIGVSVMAGRSVSAIAGPSVSAMAAPSGARGSTGRRRCSSAFPDPAILPARRHCHVRLNSTQHGGVDNMHPFASQSQDTMDTLLLCKVW